MAADDSLTPGSLPALIRLEEAELALAKLSHVVRTRCAWLSPALTLYRVLEPVCPAIADLNDDFERNLRDLESVLLHAKEMLRRIGPDHVECDIVTLLYDCATPLLLDFSYDGPAALTMHGDERLLRGAFMEILVNAAAAMRDAAEPSVRLAVTPIAIGDAPAVRISIADSGPGVPPELKGRIFDECFSYCPGGDLGDGLGLHYARQVIQAHGGEIREVGRAGEGARFEIDLPLGPHEAGLATHGFAIGAYKGRSAVGGASG